MTPLERTAVALANHDARQVDVPEIASIEEFRFDDERANYLACARAVLEAIREPSAEMSETAFKKGACGGHEDCWKAMIDAALEEG